ARPLVWSPDSRYVAFMNLGERSFKNVHIAAAQGGAAKPITFLANVFANSLSWSPDGTYLLFDTGQRTEGNRLARIDLTLRTPKFREDQFADLFKDTAPKPPAKPATPSETQPAPAADTAKDDTKRDTKKPVEIVFDGIRDRLSILPVGVELFSQTISPDGKTLLMTAVAANQVNLYTWTLD